MANVKPGDRAVVIAGEVPQNVGKIVSVVERTNDGDPMRGNVRGILMTGGELGWWCESLGSDFIFVNMLGEVVGSTPIAPVADKNLRRLVDPGRVSLFNQADEISSRTKEHV